MTITYTINRELATLGIFNARELRSLPLSEIDFQTLAAAHDGVQLQRYRQRKGKAYRRIGVRLQFDSFAAFNEFFAMGAAYGGANYAAPQVARREGGGYLTVPLAIAPAPEASSESGAPNVVDADTAEIFDTATRQRLERQFYQEFFANNQIRVRVNSPRRIANISSGEARGSRANRQYSLAELIAADSDIIWRVDW